MPKSSRQEYGSFGLFSYSNFLFQSWAKPALDLFLQSGERTGEGAVLRELGRINFSLGRKRQGLVHLRQAWNIFKDSDDFHGKGSTLLAISDCFIEQRHFDVALASLLLARQCFEKLGRDAGRNEIQEQIDALQTEVTEQQFAFLLTQAESQAIQLVEQGLISFDDI